MEKLEQSLRTPEISTAEALKIRASDRINEDIERARKRMEETDLSKDDVLISKLDIPQLQEEQKKINKYEDELKEVEAGTINPEYVIFNHGDADKKLELVTEKISPESELAGILKSEQEVRALPAEESDFIRKYESDLNRLRDVTARHKEVEKEMKERGVGQEDEVWLRADRDNLELDLRKRRDTFFKDMDPKHVEELKSLGGRFGKRDALRGQVMSGRGFTDTPFTPHKVGKADGSGQEVLSYYGQVDKLHSEFRNAEKEYFPRNPEKEETTKKQTERKEEVTPVGASEIKKPKAKDQNSEALKKVKESLGINTSSVEETMPEKTEKTFVSPEAVNGYKTSIEKMSDNFRSLDRILRRRSDDGLTDLIDDNEAGRLTSIMRQLGEKGIKEQHDFEEVSSLFTRLTDTVESIGTFRSRNVRDSVDSLKTVANALMMMGEGSQDVARQLKAIETPEAIQAAKKADRLADTIFDRRMAMLRRMDQVGEYSGR